VLEALDLLSVDRDGAGSSWYVLSGLWIKNCILKLYQACRSRYFNQNPCFEMRVLSWEKLNALQIAISETIGKLSAI
jgi:hypothetical protein